MIDENFLPHVIPNSYALYKQRYDAIFYRFHNLISYLLYLNVFRTLNLLIKYIHSHTSETINLFFHFFRIQWDLDNKGFLIFFLLKILYIYCKNYSI